jgi:hypothetical protein
LKMFLFALQTYIFHFKQTVIIVYVLKNEYLVAK